MAPAAVPAKPEVSLRTELKDGRLSVPLALSYQQLVLEQKTATGWKPLAVVYPRSLSREHMRNITFPMPSGVTQDQVRVQGYRSPKFPTRITYAKRSFTRPVAGAETGSSVSKGLDRLKVVPKTAPQENSAQPASLWRLVNNQLLHYHHTRGLQVLDIREPSSPFRLGSLRLPLRGQQMHLLNADATNSLVGLLGKSEGKQHAGKTVLSLLRITDGIPALAGELRLEGRLVDSLAGGDRLLALSTLSEPQKAPTTLLIQVDLTDPEKPRVLSTTRFTGGQPAFHLRDGRLMVQVEEAGQKRLHEVAAEKGAILMASRPTPTTQHQVQDYILQIADQKLMVINSAANGETLLEMPLGWRTDRVLPAGDFLLQVEDGISLGHASEKRNSPSRLRITPANDPDLLLEELMLGPGRVVAITLQGERLFIAQWVPATATQGSLLRTWVLDLSDPSAVTVRDSQEQPLQGLDDEDLDLDDVQPLWVAPDRLVWFLPAQPQLGRWWERTVSLPRPLTSRQRSGEASSIVMALCPVKVTEGKLDAAECQVLRIQGHHTHTSPAVAEAGFLFFSHDISDEVALAPGVKSAVVQVPLRPRPGQVRSWLQVVDFRSGQPQLRDAVSLPGQLLGVIQPEAQGAILLTQSDLFLRPDTAPVRVVQASAYDGVHAYQLSDYVTATSFNSAAVMDDLRLYLARETGKPGVVALGYEPVTGRVSQLSSWNTAALPNQLHVAAGHLLASSLGNLEVARIDAESGSLTAIASYDTPVNLWLQVARAAVTGTLDLWIPAGEYGVEYLQKQTLNGR